MLTQILGPDNPGRLRAMGRGMSLTKLACFQVKSKCMAAMEEKQIRLQKKVHELEKILLQRQGSDIGENSIHRVCTNFLYIAFVYIYELISHCLFFM